MRIQKLILENYAGIINGIGKKKIELDFSKCDKKIIMLLGLNGKGKSTILSSLHPYSETFNGKYPIKENKEGYKEIHYLTDSNDLVIIKHVYTKDATMKSFIELNGDEKNKKGGVKIFEDLVTQLLGVTKEFFKLLFLGSEKQNFISMNSSTRKDFIGKFMPSIDDYLTAYNVVHRKILDINKKMKFLTDDINILGDINNVMQKLSLSTNKLKSIKSELSNLQKSKMELELNFNKAKENIDSFSDTIELYNELSEKIEKLNIDYENIISKYPKTFKDKSINDIKSLLKETKEIKNKLNSELVPLSILISNQEIKINQNKEEINNLNIVKERYKIVDTKQINIMANKLEDIKTTNTNLLSVFKLFTNENYTSILNEIDEYNINNCYTYLLSYYEDCRRVFSEDINEFLVNEDFNVDPLGFKTELTVDLIDSLEKKINIKQQKIITCQNELDALEVNNTLIALCNDKTCKVYNKNKEMSNLKVDIKKYNKELVELKEELDSNKSFIQLLENAYIFKESSTKIIDILKVPKYTNIFKILSAIYTEFNLITKSNTDKKIFTLLNDIPFMEISNKIEQIRTLIEIKSKYNKYVLNLSNIELYEKHIKDYNNNTQIISEAENKAIDAKIENDKLSIELKLNKDKLITLQTSLTNTDKKENVCNLLISIYNEKTLLEKDFIIVNKKYESCKDDDILVKTIDSKIKEIDILIKNKNNEIILLEQEINELNLNIMKYDELTTRIKLINDKLSSFMYIQNSLDIKTGIPLVLLGTYLEDIKTITNELLTVAFKLPFKIDFKLSDKEFNIPVNKDGEFINDANMTSSGEMSLIKISLSIGIIINAIKDMNIKYNIPLLDEIDGQLDINNKMAFINILQLQMKLLDASQCFVITHNDNFSDADLGLILLDGHTIDINDELFMSNKYIIYNSDK